MVASKMIMAGGFRGLKKEQNPQPTKNALFIPERTKIEEKILTVPYDTHKSSGIRTCCLTQISCCFRTRLSVVRPLSMAQAGARGRCSVFKVSPEACTLLSLREESRGPALQTSSPDGGGPGRALGRGSQGPRGRGPREAPPLPCRVAASSYCQGLGGSTSRARRLGSGSRIDSSSRSPSRRGPRCSRCSCSRARRYMASSFSRRALKALGLPSSPSGPPPLALGFLLAPSEPGVSVAASAGAPLLPSPGNRKA